MFVGASRRRTGRELSNSGSPARSAVEPSFERHPYRATSSSRPRVPAAHHRQRNANVSRQGGGSAPCGMTLNSRPVRYFLKLTITLRNI